MKLKPSIIKFLAAGAFLTLAPASFAADQSFAASVRADAAAPAAACFQFDRQPRRCENQGCVYNYRTDRCTRGGGGRANWVCDARDLGFEEHWRGHEGVGLTRQQAERRAVVACQRFHGSCYVANCQIQR